ncbi:sensor histidine kinase [Sulfurimonas sp.]|uniref:sensor histidine kinase n=1 Tax=Sulfurimonas sp. TaxID=2022749 RepID=UPI003D0C2DDF
MKIKPFLQLIYALSSLFIALFTAIMTYVIIGEPIGFKMSSKIALTIVATLPMIALVSYFIGSYLSKKFTYIASRLDTLDTHQLPDASYSDKIVEITNIHNSIDALSKRLYDAIDSLKTNNKHLNIALRSLSHDIKTPLTIIDGYLDEFEDGLVTNEELPKVVNILKKETAYLKELSSEVIFYIQSQQMQQTSQKEIALKQFLDQEVCPLIRVNKDVIMHCDIQENNTITFHPTALKQILFNLLHNASKYTQKGFITIKFLDGNIVVEDTGSGISSKYKEEIFEPFVSLDANKNREINGFGLGLSIASNLAKNNHYTLTLDQNYTKGCRFILEYIY